MSLIGHLVSGVLYAASQNAGEQQFDDVIVMADETDPAEQVSLISKYCFERRCVEIDELAFRRGHLLRFRFQERARFIEMLLPSGLGNAEIDIRYFPRHRRFIVEIYHGLSRPDCSKRDFISVELSNSPVIADRQYVNCEFVGR